MLFIFHANIESKNVLFAEDRILNNFDSINEYIQTVWYISKLIKVQ